jgi:sugar phosphate isomerase/epimerase
MLIIANPLQNPVHGRPLDVAIREFVEIGITGLELCTPALELCVTPGLRNEFSKKIATTGLRFIRYNSLIPQYFDTLVSKDQVPGIIAAMKADVDVCVDLGIQQLLTWEGRIPPGTSQEEINGWVLDETVGIFRAVMNYAEEKGVSVSLEVHPFSLGTNVKWLVELCDRVGSSEFGVTYDCAHFAVAHPEAYIESIYQLGPRIKHLHFSDSDLESSEVHFAPGEGKMDLDGVITALEDIKFSGTTMIDVWLYPFPLEAIQTSIDFMKAKMSHLISD